MLAAFGITALGAIDASAQTSGQDVATAQALFDEGKRLMGLGKYGEACPKLVESQRIDPGGGTLLAIALCHEGEGKTATAWAEFSTALAEARKDRRADRESAATEHVKKLEGKLTRVRVSAAKVEGLEVRRDGARLGDAQWGLPLPVDPGEHTFEATAPGKRPWKQVIDVRGEGAVVDVNVPALEDAPAAAAPVAAPEPAAATPPPSVAPPPAAAAETSAPSGTQKTIALVSGGVGLAAAAVGLGFGLSASSKWNDVEKACPNRTCTNEAQRQVGKDAGTAADVSTVLVTVGAVGIVAGVVLWLTAPSGSNAGAGEKSARGVRVLPTATRDGAGIAIGGLL